MSYRNINNFIKILEDNYELIRVKTFVSTELEMTEIVDRIVKANGKAILFENNGSCFPVLMNAFGSERYSDAACSQASFAKASASSFLKVLVLASLTHLVVRFDLLEGGGRAAVLPIMEKPANFHAVSAGNHRSRRTSSPRGYQLQRAQRVRQDQVRGNREAGDKGERHQLTLRGALRLRKSACQGEAAGWHHRRCAPRFPD